MILVLYLRKQPCHPARVKASAAHPEWRANIKAGHAPLTKSPGGSSRVPKLPPLSPNKSPTARAKPMLKAT